MFADAIWMRVQAGTKATQLNRRTKDLRTVQMLLGHSKPDSTVRYLGNGIDDALEMSEKMEVLR